jgi:hypothetical protein
MTPQKKVVIIKTEFAGKPMSVSFIRHCQDVSCMLGRFDIINNYAPTPASNKRVYDVCMKYGLGQHITATIATLFFRPEKENHEKGGSSSNK